MSDDTVGTEGVGPVSREAIRARRIAAEKAYVDAAREYAEALFEDLLWNGGGEPAAVEPLPTGPTFLDGIVAKLKPPKGS